MLQYYCLPKLCGDFCTAICFEFYYHLSHTYFLRYLFMLLYIAITRDKVSRENIFHVVFYFFFALQDKTSPLNTTRNKVRINDCNTILKPINIQLESILNKILSLCVHELKLLIWWSTWWVLKVIMTLTLLSNMSFSSKCRPNIFGVSPGIGSIFTQTSKPFRAVGTVLWLLSIDATIPRVSICWWKIKKSD